MQGGGDMLPELAVPPGPGCSAPMPCSGSPDFESDESEQAVVPATKSTTAILAAPERITIRLPFMEAHENTMRDPRASLV
jgi:hypothetical protein